MNKQTRQYQQLTLGQRYQIQVLLKGHMQKEIAVLVGISEGALSRELSRNTGDQGYCPEVAHALATKRRVSAKKHNKSDERHMPIIRKGLSLGWSPENIACRMKVEVPGFALSHATVYKRIADDKARGGSLYKDLPRFGKRRCKVSVQTGGILPLLVEI